MKKRLKIDGIIIFCAFVVMMLFPSLFFRRDKITSLDQAAEMFGVALILLGQILRVSARGFKSENSLNGHSLIQGGPYSFVRNPMYLGIALIGLGVGLVLFNGVVLCIVLLVLLIRY
ncbi:MAG: methyltransferase, partial [Candidatus Omnitrophota bacterium]